ncbi:thioesterase family protein [Nocardioides ginsengisoli]|uniref:Thioesterase family protein n=1 Tax=Nocardioides ginsengisoli TaxID=363868 RepID=A0ABW3W6N2_9ACTN
MSLQGAAPTVPDGPERSDAVRRAVQLRWADVDALGHVNNVAYAAYFEDAHRAFLEDGLAVTRQAVTYLRPLMFGTGATIATRAWVDPSPQEPVVLAELCEEGTGSPRVHARSRAVLGSPPSRSQGERPSVAPIVVERGHHLRVAVRVADLSPRGDVADTAVFEFLQEARIALMAEMDLEPTSTVVAQKDVHFHRPAPEHWESVEMWSWVSRIGNRSMAIDSVVASGATIVARGSSTLVFFDARAQRSVTPPESVTRALRSWQL